MKIIDVVTKKLGSFIDIFDIQKYDDRVDILSGGASEYFIEHMDEEEKRKILRNTRTYLKTVEKLRFALRMQKKDQILDPNDSEYKDLDARSLNYMLEDDFNDPYKIIQAIENSMK